jgi:hypothetical protein
VAGTYSNPSCLVLNGTAATGVVGRFDLRSLIVVGGAIFI